MDTVYLDFIVESGYTSLSKETVISANVFPKAVNVSYVQLTPISTANTGYGFINKDSGIFL